MFFQVGNFHESSRREIEQQFERVAFDILSTRIMTGVVAGMWILSLLVGIALDQIMGIILFSIFFPVLGSVLSYSMMREHGTRLRTGNIALELVHRFKFWLMLRYVGVVCSYQDPAIIEDILSMFDKRSYIWLQDQNVIIFKDEKQATLFKLAFPNEP